MSKALTENYSMQKVDIFICTTLNIALSLRMLDKIQQGWRSPGWVNYLLLPVTALYATLVFVRRLLFKTKLLKGCQLVFEGEEKQTEVEQ